MQQFFPEEEHLFNLDTETDALNTLRFITAQRPKPLAWRDSHPYMLADDVQYVPKSEVCNVLWIEVGLLLSY